MTKEVLKHSQEHKGIRWEVDPRGGYMLYVQGVEGNLLYRDCTIGNKRRGGLFACIPQFGPDATTGESSALPQHGFGRTSLWTIGRISTDSVVMHHTCDDGDYEGLHTSLEYGVDRAANGNPSISATIILFSDAPKSVRIAPAFHPYLDLSRLNGQALNDTQRNLAEAQTVPVKMASLAVSDTVEVVVQTSGFERMTWWTDALGKYVCIEPSLAGPSFSTNPTSPIDAEMLEPGEVREYGMNLTWRPIESRTTARNTRRHRR